MSASDYSFLKLSQVSSDALKDLHVSIIRIRNAVKYVRSSPARLQIFKDFAKEVLDPTYKLAYVNYCFDEFLEEDCVKIWTNKACVAIHDRFKQSNKTCLDDAKTEVARYLVEDRIDSIGDEYLDLLTWWKVNSSQFKIISQVARDIYSISVSTVTSESTFSTGGRVLDSFRSSLTPQTAEALICAQNWIQSKPLDDMTEEIDEEFINIRKEMEAAFENLNNDSMKSSYH
uniref:HAT C-terminal dimerisation domain-containing protein n=1 Tax=Cucumis melo TaxID=3656 RepID=A0A9I9E7C1_CUCME